MTQKRHQKHRRTVIYDLFWQIAKQAKLAQNVTVPKSKKEKDDEAASNGGRLFRHANMAKRSGSRS
jgi:hypothetical protein